MKLIWKTLLAATMAGLSALPGWAQDKVIKMGTMSWEDLTPITGITRHVLEEAGYTVEVTSFSEWGIAYPPDRLPRGVEGLRNPCRSGNTRDQRARNRQARSPEGVRLRRRRPRRQSHAEQGRDLLHYGAVGQRQVHPDPPLQPPDRAQSWQDTRSWRGHRRDERRTAAGVARAPCRHGVSGRRPAAATHRARERRLRPRSAGYRQG